MNSKSGVIEHYHLDTDVLVGSDCLEHELISWSQKHGQKGTILLGQGRSVPAARLASLFDALARSGISVETISTAGSDSSFRVFQTLASAANARSTQWFAAIGGASVIDTAKLLALRHGVDPALPHCRSLEELCGRISDFSRLPLLVAPTCIGSGAEVSPLADIAVNARDVRFPIISKTLHPDRAVIDISLAKAPRDIQAAAIVDAAVHMLDPWLNSQPLRVAQTDTLVALLAALVRLTCSWTADTLTSDALLQLVSISHLAVRPGLGRPSAPVSVIHRLEHAVSPWAKCRHGEGLAFLLPAFLRWLEESRPDAVRSVAEDFITIFGRDAHPSRLVDEWLSRLPMSVPNLRLSTGDIEELSSRVVSTFGSPLPGELAIEKDDVRSIFAITQARARTQRPRASLGAVNAHRVFGQALPSTMYSLVFTPIPSVFEKLTDRLPSATKRGWFSTAVAGSTNGDATVIVCPSPGRTMAEDCLDFLASVAGLPSSVLFLGFAGALADDLSVGMVASPRFVISQPHDIPVKTFELASLPADLNTLCVMSSALTSRSVRRMSDESPDLLARWRWNNVHLIDLELSSVAQFCCLSQTPLSALLVVSDRPLHDGPLWCHPPLSPADTIGSAVTSLVRRVGDYLSITRHSEE